MRHEVAHHPMHCVLQVSTLAQYPTCPQEDTPLHPLASLLPLQLQGCELKAFEVIPISQA